MSHRKKHSNFPIDDQSNLGKLTLFTYEFGCYFGGYWDYKIIVKNDIAYFIANGSNGIELKTSNFVDSYVLEKITRILLEFKVFSWNGFDESHESILDGYSFNLVAEYENRALRAHGYEKYPINYQETHNVLADYLEKIANSLDAPTISNRKEICDIYVNPFKRIGIRISINEVYKIYYHHFETTNELQLIEDELIREKIESFIDFICDYYNQHKDETGDKKNKMDGGFSIMTNNKEFGIKVYHEINFIEKYSEENMKIKEIALAFVNKTPGFIGSEKYKFEKYIAKFIETELYFYEENGLGKVIIDMPGQTVKVNDHIYKADRQVMLDLHSFIVNKHYNFEFDFRYKGQQLQSGYLESNQTAEDIFEKLILKGYTWIFGEKHVRNCLHLYGDKERPQEGWQKAVSLIKGVINKSKRVE